MYSSILVVSDNEAIVSEIIRLISEQPELSKSRTFQFACHPENESMKNKKILGYVIEPLNIKKEYQDVLSHYDLVLSAHCKQIFPPQLIESVKCINIHPGYNPHNRGWYPQVFSILNSQPLGATIHEIDSELDHGQIIDREIVPLKISDTSLSAYQRVQDMEFILIKRNLDSILEGTYSTFSPESEGNLNLKKDFDNLCEIKIEETVTYMQAIDRLRALSHPPFRNAYFTDPESGERIYVEISLKNETETTNE